MINFFITGLPRSRTAWLANLFTTDRTLCYHEPRDLFRPGDFDSRQFWPYAAVGASDSTLADRFPRLVLAFPKARWLLVDREPQSALRSFLEFTRTVPRPAEREVAAYFRKQQDAIDALRGHAAVLVLPYTSLGTASAVSAAWEWLLPNEPFDFARWNILDGLSVQQRLTSALAERSPV